MYEIFVHTKHYRGMEPRAIISFELPEKEWEELEETDGWKFVKQFLEQKSVARANLTPSKIADGHAECDVRLVAGQKKTGILKKFDVLKAITDEQKFCDLVFDLIEVKKTPEALAELLAGEMDKKELPHLKEVAQNGYPLFFSGMQ